VYVGVGRESNTFGMDATSSATPGNPNVSLPRQQVGELVDSIVSTIGVNDVVDAYLDVFENPSERFGPARSRRMRTSGTCDERLAEAARWKGPRARPARPRSPRIGWRNVHGI
jgi:hypothetical protein